MAAASGRYRVTPRARDDLINIARYTEKTWGKKQRNVYLKKIESRFEWLANQPLLGQHRVEIKEGYYSFAQGHHVIFYRISDQGIDILGVPHKAMDMMNTF